MRDGARHMSHSDRLQQLLGSSVTPVAIAFKDAPPAGVPRIEPGAPSGCTYWKLAAEGRTFWTEAADHFGCPVGAHTHGIDAPPEVQKQLGELVQIMVGLQYLRMEEVPGIPRL